VLSSPAAETTLDVSVSVGPVSIPAAVDRPQIVVATAANQVRLDDFKPLELAAAGESSIVIAENLAAPPGQRARDALPENLERGCRLRVAIEVTRFESVPGTMATLDAAWRFGDGGRPCADAPHEACASRSKDQSYEALAAAHSRAAARLSQDIGGAIRGMIERAAITRTGHHLVRSFGGKPQGARLERITMRWPLD